MATKRKVGLVCPRCRDRYTNPTDLRIIIKEDICIHCIGEVEGGARFREVSKKYLYQTNRKFTWKLAYVSRTPWGKW